MVFAVILTHWEMELDKPGELENYTLRTRHAAIRGFNYYQKSEAILQQLHAPDSRSRQRSRVLHLPAGHAPDAPVAGRQPVQIQPAFRIGKRLGPGVMQAYYLQQLDWTCGVFNLWNHVNFRRCANLEEMLSMAGLAFHQMCPLLRFDSHLFQRPSKRASFWPKTHANWAALNRTGQMPRVW